MGHLAGASTRGRVLKELDFFWGPSNGLSKKSKIFEYGGMEWSPYHNGFIPCAMRISVEFIAL